MIDYKTEQERLRGKEKRKNHKSKSVKISDYIWTLIQIHCDSWINEIDNIFFTGMKHWFLLKAKTELEATKLSKLLKYQFIKTFNAEESSLFELGHWNRAFPSALNNRSEAALLSVPCPWLHLFIGRHLSYFLSDSREKGKIDSESKFRNFSWRSISHKQSHNSWQT